MEPLASWSVVEIKCYKTQSVLLLANSHRYNLVPVTQDLLYVSGRWRPEERSQKKERSSPRMSREPGAVRWRGRCGGRRG